MRAMRPRERDEQEDDYEAAPPSETSPAPKPSARGGGGLSSMVVRPSPPESEEGGEGSEPDDEGGRSNRRGDSPDLPQYRRWDRSQSSRRRGDSAHEIPSDRGDSSPDYRRRRHNPSASFRHGGSPPDERRRVGSPGFQHRYQRFHDDSGNPLRAGSASPLRHRPDARHEPDFDNFVGPHFSHGFRGGRGGRFRNVSPNHWRGRGGRPLGRGYAAFGRGRQPPHGEYIHRNDPNLSPREGDWICQNPSCGNLNFARRTHCNNCNVYRYGADLDGPARSPRRGYFDSSPTHGSAPRIFGPPIDRGPRKNMDRYRSPRGWEFDDARDFRPSQGHVGRFADQMRRNFPNDLEYRTQDKSGWSDSQWDGRDSTRHRLISERRGYDRRTPSPGAQWIPRHRSRSPLAERPLKASFGRARGDRPFDSYVDHGRRGHSDVGRGRGYQHRDSFTGRGGSGRRGQDPW